MDWSDVRRNWKLIAAITLALLAALATALTVAFFPPAIVAIAGFSIVGMTPFTGLLGFSLVGQCFAAAGIVAAATLCASFLFNAVVKVYNSLDAEIKPGPRPGEYPHLFEVPIEDEFDSSNYSMQRSLGQQRVAVVSQHAELEEPFQPSSASIFVATDAPLPPPSSAFVEVDQHPLVPGAK